ncbi:hypothetical protein RFI_22282 [Reticulomyxa filosa]|uniref:PH domain-containing protein n=1 Tax=Reticulomyxa filosa TaxID=46433 RepID=X6MM39_RETFI|nr:hypothetical protein RFI_22282 [Reticulomyxa filosa]|eukprot:ETO15083.1 hypothetical protein RFI_22282 [Reticulomyxa filosa]
MKENTRREQVKEVEERFGGSIVLLAPARRFVMEGNLCKIERRDDRDYVFFLFTDCLVYGSQPSFATNLKYQNTLPIDSVFEVKEPHLKLQNDFGFVFEIHSSVESFCVYTDDEETKKKWVEAMLKQKNDYKELGVRTNQDLIAATMFLPDDFSAICMIQTCQTKFTFIERRHHCYYW